MILFLLKIASGWGAAAGFELTVITAVTFSATNWLATLTALVTSLASSSTSIWLGWPSMPPAWGATNVLGVTISNAVLVVVPNAAVAPVSGVETPSLMAPGGMGANFDVVVAVAPLAPEVFFDELPQAASTIAPAGPIARHDTYRGRLCMNAPRFPESGAAVPPAPDSGKRGAFMQRRP